MTTSSASCRGHSSEPLQGGWGGQGGGEGRGAGGPLCRGPGLSVAQGWRVEWERDAVGEGRRRGMLRMRSARPAMQQIHAIRSVRDSKV